MKQYLLLLLLSVLAFTACKDEATDPVLNLGNAPAFTSPSNGTSYVLTEAKKDDVFAVFNWSAAEFGFQAGVTYTLQMDVAGKNFADPIILGSTNKLSLGTITVGAMNNFLFTSKSLSAGDPHEMEFRLAAKVSPEVETVYSPVIKLTITPYEIVINYDALQVPGAYQGWDPSNTKTVIYSVKNNGKYEGYVYFANQSEFKFTKGYSWATNWGDDGGNGTLEPNGANINSPATGMHRLNVDLNSLTYTVASTNWGLIGSATPDGWNSDQNMTYDDVNNKLTITLDLVAGEIKFRANDDWGVNLGDDGANKSLEYGGANIAIPAAGNYTIDLLLDRAVYT
ncbi:MAG: SusE domain-containing protein, partial [Bacteroidetes bacterium]|nr:SusE domain-containing protein [Bacteroidota bacterium]